MDVTFCPRSSINNSCYCSNSMISPQTLLSEFIAVTAHNRLRVGGGGGGADFCCESVDNSVPTTHDFSNLIEIKLTKIHIIQFIWVQRCSGGKTALKGHSRFYFQ